MQQIQVLLYGTFWNLLLFFNIFNLRSVESTDVEPMDTKDQLYFTLLNISSFLMTSFLFIHVL